MKNNFWEEQNSKDYVYEYHESVMEGVGLPEWAKIDCPFCEKKIPLRGIRNIGLKFNARNFGDVTVEFLCEDCEVMDTVYFRYNINNIEDFANLLCNKNGLDTMCTPIVEEKMYKMQYNNLMERKSKEVGDKI